ncbi:MAG: nucleotide-binding universal stress UspA family protein [Candidatus Aldehydirespiratoraceae bacterium]|jgi:nucleotide-binding universal stress UspA family protein
MTDFHLAVAAPADHGSIDRPLIVTGWGDRSAVHEATAVARALGRIGSPPATLLSVVDHIGDVSASESETAENLLANRTVDAHVERLLEVVEALSTKIETAVRRGPTVPKILDAVERDGYDIVVVLSDGSEMTTRIVERLIEACPVPVLLEPTDPQEVLPSVVVAIDPDASVQLTQRLLWFASAIARSLEGELHLVHAWEVAGQRQLLSSSVGITARELGDHASTIEQTHTRAFDRALVDAGLADIDDIRVTRHLVEGPASVAIHRVVALNHIGLVVTGSSGRPSIDRAVDGSQSLSIALGKGHATLIVTPLSRLDQRREP